MEASMETEWKQLCWQNGINGSWLEAEVEQSGTQNGSLNS